MVLDGVRAFPYPGRGPLRLDFASLLGPLFFMWLLQLLLPVRLARLSTHLPTRRLTRAPCLPGRPLTRPPAC